MKRRLRAFWQAIKPAKSTLFAASAFVGLEYCAFGLWGDVIAAGTGGVMLMVYAWLLAAGEAKETGT